MSQNFLTKDKALLTTVEAAKLTSYTPAYLTRLAQSGKVKAKRIGRRWLVERASLENFVADTKAGRLQRKEQLRKERLKEKELFSFILSANTPPRSVSVLSVETALQSTIVIVLGGFTCFLMQIVWSDAGGLNSVVMHASVALSERLEGITQTAAALLFKQ